MTRRLNAYGISAYSWSSALGTYCMRLRRDGSVPDGPSPLDRSGLAPATDLPFATHWGRHAGGLVPLPPALLRHRSRCTQIFWASLHELEADILRLIERWGPHRVGLVVGSSTSGIDITEQVVALEHQGAPLPWDYDFDAVHPFSALLHMAEGAFPLQGPSYVVSTACSSSGKALAAAQRLLEAGFCDAVIVGGTDALCQMTLRGFSALGILSSEGCRPFDVARSGINIGEGSAVLLLERLSTSPLGLLGAGESNDAYHTTAPHPEGLGARIALESALTLSGLDPAEVDYVNAHGTGTRQNDTAEALALRAVFGERVVYSSTKDRVGHQLGAAGATEAAFCLDALARGVLPGNRRDTEVDPALPVAPFLSNRALPAERRAQRPAALSNSFAFGGSNVAVALGVVAPERLEARPSAPSPGSVWVESLAFWTRGYPSWTALWSGESDPEEIRPPALLLPTRPRGRASLLTRLFAELLGQLTDTAAAGTSRSDLPVIYGSALGEMTTTLALLDQLGREEPLSPAGFQSSVHNTAAGVLSIALENRAFSTALAAGSETLAMSLVEAVAWLSVHGGRVAVLVADEDAPTRLRPRGSYPAAGIGLLLGHGASPPAHALGLLDGFERRPPATPSAFERETLERVAERAPGLDRATAAQGFALARALLDRLPGRYAVGDTWSVRVSPIPR